jgi:hypothetical protein
MGRGEGRERRGEERISGERGEGEGEGRVPAVAYREYTFRYGERREKETGRGKERGGCERREEGGSLTRV